jgi:hypothetical protein
VNDNAGAVAAVAASSTLDRAAIRARAVERFGVARMADAYLEAYRQIARA